MKIGIPINPYATNVSEALLAAARTKSMQTRSIDLPTLRVAIAENGQTKVADSGGIIEVDAIAPYLLFGYPAAVHALRVLMRSVKSQNPIDGVLTADDKAATAERLSVAGVLQLRTITCAQDPAQVIEIAGDIGYPVVVKRTHGAQGKWVRQAADDQSLRRAVQELSVEGPGALILQPQVIECSGRSIRVVITGGEIIATTEHIATPGEWKSNITLGGSRHRIDLSQEEKNLALSAAEAIGVFHAGIDMLRTNAGPRVLEVNSCPDFTGIQPFFKTNLAAEVLNSSV